MIPTPISKTLPSLVCWTLVLGFLLLLPPTSFHAHPSTHVGVSEVPSLVLFPRTSLERMSHSFQCPPSLATSLSALAARLSSPGALPTQVSPRHPIQPAPSGTHHPPPPLASCLLLILVYLVYYSCVQAMTSELLLDSLLSLTSYSPVTSTSLLSPPAVIITVTLLLLLLPTNSSTGFPSIG